MISVLLIIIGTLILLLLLLLCVFLFVPAKLRITLHNSDLVLTLSFCGIPLFRYPAKKEKAAKKNKSSKPAEDKPSLPLPPKDADAEALLAYVKHLLTELGSLSTHTKLTLYQLWVTPPKTDDAASQALLAGTISGLGAAFLGFLDQNCHLVIQNTDSVRITPNFLETNPSLMLDLSVAIAPYRVFGSLVRLSERLQNI